MNTLFKACTIFIEDFNEISFLKKLPQSPCLISEKDYTLNYKLLEEELNEYRDACVAGDLTAIADALGDEFFVLWGKIAKHGMQKIFLEKVLLPICISNKTKHCETREQAIESVKAYGDRNVTYVEQNGVYGVFDADSMKMLKGINYQDPVIEI